MNAAGMLLFVTVVAALAAEFALMVLLVGGSIVYHRRDRLRLARVAQRACAAS